MVSLGIAGIISMAAGGSVLTTLILDVLLGVGPNGVEILVYAFLCFFLIALGLWLIINDSFENIRSAKKRSVPSA